MRTGGTIGLLAGLLLALAFCAPAHAQWQSYLQEDFESEEPMFPAGRFGEALYSVDTQGRYIIDGIDATQDSLSALTDSLYYYRMQADCQVLSSSAGELAFCGLIFHYGRRNGEDKPSYYVFYVYGDGFYGVKRMLGSQADIILPLTKTDLLKDGQPNTLAVEANGTRFNLFINGTPVDSFTDVKIDGGGFGFYISKHTIGAFDNFLVQVQPREPAGDNGPSSAESGERGGGRSGIKAPVIPRNPNRPLYPWEVGYEKDPKKKKRALDAKHKAEAADEAKHEPAAREKPSAEQHDKPSGTKGGKAKPKKEELSRNEHSRHGDGFIEDKPAREGSRPSLRPQSAHPLAPDGGLPDAEIKVEETPIQLEEPPAEPPATEAPAQPQESAPAEPAPDETPSDESAPGGQPSSDDLLYRPAPGFDEPPAETDSGGAAEVLKQAESPAPEETAPTDQAAGDEPAVAPPPVEETPAEPAKAGPSKADIKAAKAQAKAEAKAAKAEAKVKAAQAEADAKASKAEDQAKASKNPHKHVNIGGDDWDDPNARSESHYEASAAKPVDHGTEDAPDKPASKPAKSAAKPDKPVQPDEEKPVEVVLKPEPPPAEISHEEPAPELENPASDELAPAPSELGSGAESEPQPAGELTLPDLDLPEEQPAPATDETDRTGPGADGKTYGPIPADSAPTPAEEPPVESSTPGGPALETSALGDVKIDDDFSFVHWPVSDNGTSRYAYEGDAYVIANEKAQTMAISFQLDRRLTDCELQVDAEGTGGLDYVGYGLAARFNVKDGVISYYGIFVSRSGEFMLLKVVNGTESVLRDWAATPLLDPGHTNRIGLRVVGGTITALINGQVVAEVQDGDIASGGYALLAGPGVDARYDNLAVRGKAE